MKNKLFAMLLTGVVFAQGVSCLGPIPGSALNDGAPIYVGTGNLVDTLQNFLRSLGLPV